MKWMKNFIAVISLCSLAFLSVSTYAENENTMSSDSPPTSADTAEVNERDTIPGELNADQQLMNDKDMVITRRIRQELLKDQAFKTYAKRVKITTVNGTVTLKGRVNTEADQNTILEKAQNAKGVKKVINKMKVASSK
jgi:osmotically-inducible protein OsmY